MIPGPQLSHLPQIRVPSYGEVQYLHYNGARLEKAGAPSRLRGDGARATAGGRFLRRSNTHTHGRVAAGSTRRTSTEKEASGFPSQVPGGCANCPAAVHQPAPAVTGLGRYRQPVIGMLLLRRRRPGQQLSRKGSGQAKVRRRASGSLHRRKGGRGGDE